MGVSAGRVWKGSGGVDASSSILITLGARTPHPTLPFEGEGSRGGNPPLAKFGGTLYL
jgi:hypothetical protein